jgi:tetratricopeptide (TPR) repeat protein
MACVKEFVKIRCPKCEKEQTLQAVKVADVFEEPELKQLILGGELNIYSCIECETKLHYDHYMLYADPSKGLLINVFSRDYVKERQNLALKILNDFSTLSIDEMQPNYIVFGFAALAHVIALMERELSLKKETEIADLTHEDYRKLFVLGEEWINSRIDPTFEEKLPIATDKFKNALALQNDNAFDNAIEVYKQVVEILPSYYPARFNLGLLQFNNKGDLQEALINFEECLKIRPNDTESAFAIGQLMVKLNRVQEAAGHFAHAIINGPHNSIAWFNLGLSLAMVGKKEDGLDAMERSLELSTNPDDRNVISRTISSVEMKMM